MLTETSLLETYNKNLNLFNLLSGFIDSGTIKPGSYRQKISYICYKISAAEGSLEQIIATQRELLEQESDALPMSIYMYLLGLVNSQEIFSINIHGNYVSSLYYQHVMHHQIADEDVINVELNLSIPTANHDYEFEIAPNSMSTEHIFLTY